MICHNCWLSNKFFSARFSWAFEPALNNFSWYNGNHYRLILNCVHELSLLVALMKFLSLLFIFCQPGQELYKYHFSIYVGEFTAIISTTQHSNFIFGKLVQFFGMLFSIFLCRQDLAWSMVYLIAIGDALFLSSNLKFLLFSYTCYLNMNMMKFETLPCLDFEVKGPFWLAVAPDYTQHDLWDSNRLWACSATCCVPSTDEVIV